MALKDDIKWAFSTRLEDENAQEFVSRLPDIIFYAKQKHEESVDMYEAKGIFYEAMKAGIVREYKEGNEFLSPPTPPKDPKAPEYLLESACNEDLLGERIKLQQWKSLASQQENVVDSLKGKLWSANRMLDKRVEL